MSESLAAQMARTKHMPQTLTLDHVSPATRLLEKRRQMFEVQEALDAQKEEFARREEAFRRREEQLRKKDLELQDSLIKFNKFLQDNESKKNRAEKRALEKTRQRKEKEATILMLKEKLVEMQLDCGVLKSKVEVHMKYQDYLELVQQAVPEDYPEINDLLNRYKTLNETHIDLNTSQNKHEVQNEKNRQILNSYTKEQLSKILTYNNEIAILQKHLEDAETEALRLQQEGDSKIQSTSNKTLELGRRSTCKLKLLKHDETSKMLSNRSEDLLKNLNETCSGYNSNEIETLKKGQKIIADLDIISAYVIDFVDVFERCPESKRDTTHTSGLLPSIGISASNNKYTGSKNKYGGILDRDSSNRTQDEKSISTSKSVLNSHFKS